MDFVYEHIPDQDRYFLESIKSKFRGGLNSGRENIPTKWIIDHEAGEFLLPLGGEGPHYSGEKFVFFQADEIIPFYMEDFDKRIEGDERKIIRVYSIPAGMIRYPEDWRSSGEFELKKEKLFQRIVEASVARAPYLKEMRAGFELVIDENWEGGRD